MIKQLLIATNNKGKVVEIIPLLEGIAAYVISLADLENRIEVEETGNTFTENAVLKAETLFEKTGIITLADDSGIEVDAIGGRPGVYSARFAGEETDSQKNNALLLEMLKDVPEDKRTARFRCVMALALPVGTRIFDGAVEGIIVEKPQGDYGFGYDPVFRPDGYDKTFGELGKPVKFEISHRTRALNKVIDFLKNYSDNSDR
ncbi:XTP/dITP diphosphatase [candidate division KSB1 bacterium]